MIVLFSFAAHARRERKQNFGRYRSFSINRSPLTGLMRCCAALSSGQRSISALPMVFAFAANGTFGSEIFLAIRCLLAARRRRNSQPGRLRYDRCELGIGDAELWGRQHFYERD